MKKNAHAMLRACSSLVFVSALGLPAGCLYMGDPGSHRSRPKRGREHGRRASSSSFVTRRAAARPSRRGSSWRSGLGSSTAPRR